MNKKKFKGLLEDLTYELLNYKLTKYEVKYFWDRFKILSKNLQCDLSAAWEIEQMVHYDPLEIKRFRYVMACNGIELTIRQVEIWLMMLEVLLISVDFYEWEQQID